MKNGLFSWEKFLQLPVTGILRNISFEEVIQLLPICQPAGLTTIEITMNTPGAEDMIRYAISRYADDLNIGAGTVCNMADLDKALEAGARFIVTPLTDEQVINACVQEQITIFPGAFTPTEIYKAWALGADMIKVFPAASLGPQYIKEIRSPLNQINLMATGGIHLNNCIRFLEAGALGVGVGSQLFDKTMIREKNWKELAKHFSRFVEKIKAYKNAGIVL